MITENIMLRLDLKKQLQHLSIDKDEYISSMLINGASYLLGEEDKDIMVLDPNDDYLQFTMKIEESLKDEIKGYCFERGIKIKAFWNEVAYIVIQKNGDF